MARYWSDGYKETETVGQAAAYSVSVIDAERWNNKQDKLFFDDAATPGSNNLLTSGVIAVEFEKLKDYVQEEGGKAVCIDILIDPVTGNYGYKSMSYAKALSSFEKGKTLVLRVLDTNEYAYLQSAGQGFFKFVLSGKSNSDAFHVFYLYENDIIIHRVISIPTLYAWALSETKPTYTYTDVGAEQEGVARTLVQSHNTGADTHADIRRLISELTSRLNTLADSDDTTLNQLSELVAYIKDNRTLIEGVTSKKVNVLDIIDDLLTDDATKPLSARQGKVLRELIDQIVIDGEVEIDVEHFEVTGSLSMGRTEDSEVGDNSTALGTEVTAASDFSAVFGRSNTSGKRGYKVTDDYGSDMGAGTKTLKLLINTSEYLKWESGDLLNFDSPQVHLCNRFKIECFIDDRKEFVVISDTSDSGDFVYHGLLGDKTEIDFTQGYLSCSDKPEDGSVLPDSVCQGVFGEDNEAQGRSSFVAGRENTALSDYGFVSGRRNKTGYCSLANGDYCIALGEYARAGGYNATAKGNVSFAYGYYVTASARAAAVFGVYSEASGDGSLASGHYAAARGSYSVAFGTHAYAQGAYSAAFGNTTVADGSSAAVFGYNNYVSGTNGFASGANSNVTSQQGTSFGNNNTVSGTNGFASGYKVRALATNSTALGYNTETSASQAIAAGNGTKAKGENAIAVGSSTEASGTSSIAGGVNTKATGNYALAFGSTSEATGSVSFALGWRAIAAGKYQMVHGKCNVIDTPTEEYPDGKYAHIIGNGTSNTDRSNAYTLDWEGNPVFAGKTITFGGVVLRHVDDYLEIDFL